MPRSHNLKSKKLGFKLDSVNLEFAMKGQNSPTPINEKWNFDPAEGSSAQNEQGGVTFDILVLEE